MKGDPRKTTERARQIRALAARIPDAETLEVIASAVPLPRRAAFVRAITPHLKLK